ncbi:MAG: cyclic peptide export ABC transporter, partial [Polyangiaceae bacterium]
AMIACLAYMVVLSTSLLALAVGAIAVGACVSYVLLRPARHRAQRAREAQERTMGYVEDLVLGTKELKMSSAVREGFLTRAFEPSVRMMHREQAISASLQTLSASWTSVALLAAVGVLLFTRGAAPATAPVIGYAFALVYLGTEVATMFAVVPLIRTGELAFASLEKLDLFSERDASEPHAASPASAFDRLDLRAVTWSYRVGDATDFVLGPIELTLRAGEIVFFVGGNGSGKSTLAKVVAGLYAPENGAVAIGDRAEPAEEHRSRFSAVLSKWHLFDRLYGIDATDLDARARGYLDDLELGGKVKVEGGAFSTLDLSQGQRKRLALVTALLEDRPVYVFDEWAADQDPQFKEAFYRRILPDLKRRGKTAIVVTHDDRYFDAADRVIRLERGKVVG